MVKGDRYLLSDQIITRASTFPMKIFLTWKKEYDEPLVVATTSHNPDFRAEFTIEGKCKKRHYKSNNKLAYFFV
jgi:hypothetical protein